MTMEVTTDGTGQLIKPPKPLYAICGESLVKVDYLRALSDGRLLPYRIDLSKCCLVEIKAVDSLKSIARHEDGRYQAYSDSPEIQAQYARRGREMFARSRRE